MNITKISQVINEKSDGEIVMAIQAELKAVYEHRHINAGTEKATTVQNVILRDDSGEIRCSFWGHSDLAEHKGRTFVIHSNKTPKGIFGLKAKDKQDFKTKAIVRELEASKSATIQAPEAVEVKHPASAAPASKAAVKSTPVQSGGMSKIDLEVLAGFWEDCFIASDKRQKKFGFSDDIKQSMTASLFIQGMKENLHLRPRESAKVEEVPDMQPVADDGDPY